MSISRRGFVKGAAGLSLAGPGLWAAGSHAATPPVLRASKGTAKLVPGDYPATQIWGYNGGAPGPVIRVRQGERVIRRFVNELPQPSSVHWHGIRLRNAMDGVAGLTQPPVAPKDAFLYDFRAPDAGTYWYHPHNRSWEQLARGLYGALIVEEKSPPVTDRDKVYLIDDWRLASDASLQGGFGSMMDWSHGGRMGNWLTVNGIGEFQEKAKAGERLRLRLVNVANARIFPLGLRGLEGWVVALDGQPLAKPETAGSMTLAPAQRVDLIVDITSKSGETASIDFLDGSAPYPLIRFAIDGERRNERLSPPQALPPNPVPELGDIGKASRTTLRMQGGAMGMMPGAMMGGRMMGMRELVENGRVWSFNGNADMLSTPLLTAQRGDTVRIEMVNDTAWPHAMHLHGHHFRQRDADSGLGPLRDTLLLDSEETSEIVFVADNPGKWLLHCHMLEHAASGMTTWIEVSS